MGDCQTEPLGPRFDRRLRLRFVGAKVTSDAGLLAYRELDDALDLTRSAASELHDSRTGRNAHHSTTALVRHSVYGRLAGFTDLNDLGNFLRQMALPREVKHWSLTTLQEKLIKIGAKVVSRSRSLTFQMAAVAVTRTLFAAIRDRIDRLRAAPSLG